MIKNVYINFSDSGTDKNCLKQAISQAVAKSRPVIPSQGSQGFQKPILIATQKIWVSTGNWLYTERLASAHPK